MFLPLMWRKPNLYLTLIIGITKVHLIAIEVFPKYARGASD